MLAVKDLDNNARRVLELIDKSKDAGNGRNTYDMEEHHRLARKAAAESCVLLKNKDNILPWAKKAI